MEALRFLSVVAARVAQAVALQAVTVLVAPGLLLAVQVVAEVALLEAPPGVTAALEVVVGEVLQGGQEQLVKVMPEAKQLVVMAQAVAAVKVRLVVRVLLARQRVRAVMAD